MRIKLSILAAFLTIVGLTAFSFRPAPAARTYRLEMPVREVITGTVKSWVMDVGGLTTKKLHITTIGSEVSTTVESTLYFTYTYLWAGSMYYTGSISLTVGMSETDTSLLTLIDDLPGLRLQANAVSTQPITMTPPVTLEVRFYAH